MSKKSFAVDENANQEVTAIPFEMPGKPAVEMEYILCPFCCGDFAVDATYLDEVDEVIHCPMCCMEIVVTEP